MTLAKKPYVGIMPNTHREAFTSATTPTEQSHGSLYSAVIGPFRTKQGAEFMAQFGANNPHCQTVEDAEQLAREAIARMSDNNDSHYIVGNGEPGCLYDGCAVVRTLDDAVKYLSDMFNLGRTRRATLRRARYLSLNPAKDGASYCEIQHCNCAEPWVHDEQMTEEEWTWK
jgi:hypothetical protein